MADLSQIFVQDTNTTYNIKDATARNSISTLQAAVGSPLVANSASAMSDTTKIYVYTGSESGYANGHWYYYDGSAWTDGGVYNSTAIGAGTVNGSKLSSDIKQALLSIFEHVAYTDNNGQNYYDTLENALYPPTNLSSISAVYTQSGTVYDTDSLDDLKTDLVVTANYEDGTSETVANYTLSGTLEEGSSTITVTYGGKTTTFNVTVTHNSKQMLYNWDFTDSLVDSVQGVTAVLGKITGDNPTQDSSGVHITSNNQYIHLGDVYEQGTTIEVDFGTMDRQGTANSRVLMVGTVATGGLGTGFIYRSNNTWNWYASGSWDTAISSTTNANVFSNSTLKAVFDNDGHMAVYNGDVLLGTSTRAFLETDGTTVELGANSGTGTYTSYYNMTVKAVRIYKEV